MCPPEKGPSLTSDQSLLPKAECGGAKFTDIVPHLLGQMPQLFKIFPVPMLDFSCIPVKQCFNDTLHDLLKFKGACSCLIHLNVFTWFQISNIFGKVMRSVSPTCCKLLLLILSRQLVIPSHSCLCFFLRCSFFLASLQLASLCLSLFFAAFFFLLFLKLVCLFFFESHVFFFSFGLLFLG